VTRSLAIYILRSSVACLEGKTPNQKIVRAFILDWPSFHAMEPERDVEESLALVSVSKSVTNAQRQPQGQTTVADIVTFYRCFDLPPAPQFHKLSSDRHLTTLILLDCPDLDSARLIPSPSWPTFLSIRPVLSGTDIKPAMDRVIRHQRKPRGGSRTRVLTGRVCRGPPSREGSRRRTCDVWPSWYVWSWG
jgi:hypothetical protein